MSDVESGEDRGILVGGLFRKLVVRRLRFRVEEYDIALAIHGDSHHCMIADAFKRKYPEFKNVAVDLRTIRFSDAEKGLRYIYETPHSAAVALVLFDEGEEPKPFWVELRYCQVTSMWKSGTDRSAAQRAQFADGRSLVGSGSSSLPAEPAPDGSYPEGKSKRHMFGRKRIVASEVSGSTVAHQLGGKPPPVHYPTRVRRFGIKALAANRARLMHSIGVKDEVEGQTDPPTDAA